MTLCSNILIAWNFKIVKLFSTLTWLQILSKYARESFRSIPSSQDVFLSFWQKFKHVLHCHSPPKLAVILKEDKSQAAWTQPEHFKCGQASPLIFSYLISILPTEKFVTVLQTSVNKLWTLGQSKRALYFYKDCLDTCSDLMN